MLVTLFYLVVDFPFSNVGLVQLFWSENAECVCQGLKNVFEYIDGVPMRLVFDNATGVGHRVGDAIHTTKTFEAFATHYGFSFSFCNPRSGHEKGAVEAKVRYVRSNMFVPVPSIRDVREYNRELLPACMEIASKEHYAKGEPERQLFIEDVAALAELPPKPMEVVRYETAKTDKYGKVKLDGAHRYAVSPSHGLEDIIVGYGAFDVSFHGADGALIAVRSRAYGDRPTDAKDPASQLALLCRKPGGWVNSQVRASLPESLRTHIDALDRHALRSTLEAIGAASRDYGYDIALKAAEIAAKHSGTIEKGTVALLSARIADGGGIVYEKPANMAAYDVALTRG